MSEVQELKELISIKAENQDKTLMAHLIGAFADYGEMADRFIERCPIFFDQNQNFWRWFEESKCWRKIDEIDLMNLIDAIVGIHGKMGTFSQGIKSMIIEALKRRGRLNVPMNIPGTWVQASDEIINVAACEKRPEDIFPSPFTPEVLYKAEMIMPSSHFFVTNPIPWSFGMTEETPNIDRIFADWVGKDSVQLLYEITAYCLLPSYPIQRIFCLNGSGCNGKGAYLRLLCNFLGQENVCSTELDILLTSRFEVTKLYKKLLCVMGETNFNTIKNTSMLKKLSGGDLIGFEFKGKMPFNDYNYAKIIISTNSLPITGDKTDGFYRRWLIVDFPNMFTEKKDILKDIPAEEYRNLARKCVRILKGLVKARSFHNEGEIAERRKRYEERSNPINLFIEKSCEMDVNADVNFTDLFEEYTRFLGNRGLRNPGKREFGSLVRNAGYVCRKKSVDGHYDTWIEGLRIRPKEEHPTLKAALQEKNPYTAGAEVLHFSDDVLEDL